MARKSNQVTVSFPTDVNLHSTGVFALVNQNEKTFYVGRAIRGYFSQHVTQVSRLFKGGDKIDFQVIAEGRAGFIDFNEHKEAAIRSFEAAGFTKLNRDHWSDYL